MNVNVNFSCRDSSVPCEPTPTLMPARAASMTLDQSVRYLGALRKAISDPKATFRNSAQAEAVFRIMSDRENDSILIQPTGSGKSLLYLMSTILNPTLVTVVVCPLVGLTLDILSRAQNASVKIFARRWNEIAERDRTPDQAPQFLLVSAEEAVTDEFDFYLQKLAEVNLLNRIFVDEAHLVLTARTYRKAMYLLGLLRRVAVPLTLLSATLPPKMIQPISAIFKLCDPVILRSSTVRPNIAFSVQRFDDDQERTNAFLDHCKKFVQTSQSSDRLVVFAKSKGLCADIREMMLKDECLRQTNPRLYTGDTAEAERRMIQKEYSEGACRLVVATSAFGMGVDFSNIREVIHFGPTHSILDFCQEAGRGGRDGALARSTVFFSSTDEFPKAEPFCGSFSLYKEAAITGQCLRQLIHTHMDGYGWPCHMTPESQWCDACVEVSASFELAQSESCGTLVRPGFATERDCTKHDDANEGIVKSETSIGIIHNIIIIFGFLVILARMNDDDLIETLHCTRPSNIVVSAADTSERHRLGSLTLAQYLNCIRSNADSCFFCKVFGEGQHASIKDHSCFFKANINCMFCLSRTCNATNCETPCDADPGTMNECCFKCRLPVKVLGQEAHPFSMFGMKHCKERGQEVIGVVLSAWSLGLGYFKTSVAEWNRDFANSTYGKRSTNWSSPHHNKQRILWLLEPGTCGVPRVMEAFVFLMERWKPDPGLLSAESSSIPKTPMMPIAHSNSGILN